MAYSGWLIDDGKLKLACSGLDEAETQAELTKLANGKPHKLIDLSIGTSRTLAALAEFARPHMPVATFMASLMHAVSSVKRATSLHFGWYIADGHLHLGTYGTDHYAVVEKLADVAGNNLQIVLPAIGRDHLWRWCMQNNLDPNRTTAGVANAERNFASIPKANG